MKLNYVKVRDVKSPIRGTAKSAGIDFFVPNDWPGVHWLAPGQDVNIPSGIHVKVPTGCALINMNKSGISTKKHLQVGAGVIDEDYQGEIHLHVINVGTEVVSIEPGEKLLQCIIIEVGYFVPSEYDSLEELYHGVVTERGAGGFGSTNINGANREYAIGDKLSIRLPHHEHSTKFKVAESFIGWPIDNQEKLFEIPKN